MLPKYGLFSLAFISSMISQVEPQLAMTVYLGTKVALAGLLTLAYVDRLGHYYHERYHRKNKLKYKTISNGYVEYGDREIKYEESGGYGDNPYGGSKGYENSAEKGSKGHQKGGDKGSKGYEDADKGSKGDHDDGNKGSKGSGNGQGDEKGHKGHEITYINNCNLSFCSQKTVFSRQKGHRRKKYGKGYHKIKRSLNNSEEPILSNVDVEDMFKAIAASDQADCAKLLTCHIMSKPKESLEKSGKLVVLFQSLMESKKTFGIGYAKFRLAAKIGSLKRPELCKKKYHKCTLKLSDLYQLFYQ